MIPMLVLIQARNVRSFAMCTLRFRVRANSFSSGGFVMFPPFSGSGGARYIFFVSVFPAPVNYNTIVSLGSDTSPEPE
jgi:hypothetical protein